MRKDLNDALRRLEADDRALRAFLPEPHRRQRVETQAEMIAAIGSGEPLELAGLLVGVKDIINVDGLPTKGGSELPAALFEGAEASIVRRLRGAGALMAGKTTTTEFAFSEPSPTRNPRNLEHTPGGSSSGSAAAVGAGLVPIALGTQTVDSVVTPAAYCGVVGFKPTYQRIPLDGVIPFSPSMDHGGIFTTDVAMACVVASVICDDWDLDSSTSELALGIPGSDYIRRGQSSTIEVFEIVVELLRSQGIAIVETSTLTNIEAIAVTHRRLVAAEFAWVHRDWFSQYGDRYRPRTAALYAEGAALPRSAVVAGQESGDHLRGSLEDTMQREGIAAWLSPSTTGVAPVGLDYIGDSIMGMPWTHAHLPAITVPIISTPGSLPLGIQLVGRHGGDEKLLSLAMVLEEALAELDL